MKNAERDCDCGFRNGTASEEAAVMDQETVKLQEKDTRDRKHVPELRDRGLKAVRCHYTEDCRRGALRILIPKILLGSTYLHSRYLIMMHLPEP